MSEPSAPTPTAASVQLSVIVCVHNGARSIVHQLEALDRQQWDEPWEVIVVDNRSTDDTPRVIREFARSHPRFRTVAAPRSLGLAYARNVGVASSSAPAVAFCDDDDVVAEGWVAAMGTALREHPIVACRFDWSTLQGVGRSTFQRDGLGEIFGYKIAAGVGGWQRSLWDALDGNDESLTFTGEDFDMSIRAFLEHGVTPYFEPRAVCHVARRSGRRANFRQARRYGRASVVLYKRYGVGRTDRRAELRRSMKVWAWLAANLLSLRQTGEGSRWARRAGLQIGRLEQSIRSRTLWL
jgi:glycosyltransferase involved in cell wall biosynthesis